MEFDPYRLFPVFSNNRVRKNKPTIPSIAIIIFVSVLFVTLFLLSERFTNQQITILGVAGSTVFAVAVFFLSRSSEERSAYLIARNHARVLSQILDYLEKELSNISFDAPVRINYPTNWLSLYTSIAAYLEYDYLSTLIDEFALIDKINDLLTSNDKDAVVNLIASHSRKICENWDEFDIFATRDNLFWFSQNMKEKAHWSSESRYRSFYDTFIKQYSDIINADTVEYLKQHSGTCSEHEVAKYIFKEFENDPKRSMSIMGHTKYEREVLFAIYSVHRDTSLNKPYYLGLRTLWLRDKQ